jgi:hypothetical protein
MVTLSTFRQLALAFPGASEQPHFEKTAFRAGKKIFVTLDESKQLACVKLSVAEQDVFCLISKTMIYPVPNKWGQQGWTMIDLKLVTKSILTDALQKAHATVTATKSN